MILINIFNRNCFWLERFLIFTHYSIILRFLFDQPEIMLSLKLCWNDFFVWNLI